MTDTLPALEPILSLPINVARLKSLGEVVKARAEPAQCKELADRLEILDVKSFAIEAHVTPWKKGGARVAGKVWGDVEQACIVTLKPVSEAVEEDFDLILVPEGSPYALRPDGNETGGELVVDPEGEDPPEEFVGDEIDVGRYAEEFFALGLDDYPRRADAKFGGHIEDDGSDDEKENPFAALAGLKQELGDKDKN